MKSIRFRRPLAAVLAAAFATIVSLPPAWAGASFSGRVFDADGATPRPGVTVHLVQGEGARIYASNPTATDGTFVIDGAEAGSYSVLVDTPEGAFLSADALDLHAGANKPLALSLNPKRDIGLGSGAKEMDLWLKWVLAGGLGIGAILWGLSLTKSETPASNF